MNIGESFSIGPYTIIKVKFNYYWIEINTGDRCGESMGLPEEKLIELLDKFWKEYF